MQGNDDVELKSSGIATAGMGGGKVQDQKKISNESNPGDSLQVMAARHVAFSKMNEEVSIWTDDKPNDPDDRTGETPVLEGDLLIAATLVADAKAGRHSYFELTEKSVRSYIIYHHWTLHTLLYICIILNHLLALFEKPALPSFALPYWGTMGIEIGCLLFYIFRLIHATTFMSVQRFWKDKKNWLVIATILLTAIDIICYSILMNTSLQYAAYRWSRPLRPIFMVNFGENKQVRRAFRNIRRSMPGILNVLVIFFLSISLFSLLAFKLFQKRSLKYPDGSPYFKDYFDIYFNLYVLVTTANNPDVMMPAYDDNRWFALFFIIYIIICLYIFMNIFLAVIYNNYRKHLKNEVRKFVYIRRQNLSSAFRLLRIRAGDKYVLTYKRFTALMMKISPACSAMTISVFWRVLDRAAANQIDKADFLQLADLLNVGMSEVKDRKTIFEWHFPSLYNSRPSKILRKIVSHKFFRYFFDILILVNAILISSDINQAEWCFLLLFTIEIVLKMYTFGVKEFFRRYWNIFDFLVIASAIIATAAETMAGDTEEEKERTLDILLVLRVLRLVKIVGGIERFRVIVITIMNLGPSILTYGGVLCVVFYTFAIIGMELFHGKINYYGYETTDPEKLYCGNPKLKDSSFYTSHYCNNNFNNLLNSLIVLFELMVVNQWHVLTEGFVLVTGVAARLYFFCFHLFCVIIVLNIFTAFVLEAFILEYSFSKSKMESAIEKKIEEMGLRLGRKQKHAVKDDKQSLVVDFDPELAVDSDHDLHAPPPEQTDSSATRSQSMVDLSQETDIRFHISKSKNVENLLQRMFENELDVNDIGPGDVSDLDDEDDQPTVKI